MTALLTKNSPTNGVGGWDAYKRLGTSLDAAVRGNSIEWRPVGEGNEQLLRVLIVDDDQTSADTMSKLVGNWGHDVRRAYDGTSGLAQAAAFWPDVLLLDIIMPDISGIDVAQTIRRQSRLKDCFIIAVTGHIDSTKQIQPRDAGIDLFLIKPVELSNLQTLLTRVSEYRFGAREYTATQHAISKELPQREVELVWGAPLPYRDNNRQRDVK
jgi:CheY-like chemotaxis protein